MEGEMKEYPVDHVDHYFFKILNLFTEAEQNLPKDGLHSFQRFLRDVNAVIKTKCDDNDSLEKLP